MKIKILFLILCLMPMSYGCAQVVKKNSQPDSVHRTDYLRFLSINNGEDAYMELVMKYRVPASARHELMTHLNRREFDKMFLHNKEMTSHERAKEKMRIDSAFQSRIDEILIPYNNISGENISYAIRKADKLKCTLMQRDCLMTKAIYFARILRKDPKANIWNEELDVLRKVLDKKQFDKMFILKFRKKAGREAAEVWNKLSEAGMTEDLDSAKECRKAQIYFAKRMECNHVYRHDSSERQRQLSVLKKHKPRLLKMSEALDKQRRKMEEEGVESFDNIW